MTLIRYACGDCDVNVARFDGRVNPAPPESTGGFRFSLPLPAAALNGLDHRDEANGEQWKAAHVGRREHEAAAIDGITRPDVLGPAGEIEDQIVA